MFFTKYTLLAEKMLLYGKKSFIMKKLFIEKNFFYRENINEDVKNIYLISEIYFYTKNV